MIHIFNVISRSISILTWNVFVLFLTNIPFKEREGHEERERESQTNEFLLLLLLLLLFVLLFSIRLFCCWYKRQKRIRRIDGGEKKKEMRMGFQRRDDHEHHRLHGWCCYFHPSQKMKNEKTTSSLTFSLLLLLILPLVPMKQEETGRQPKSDSTITHVSSSSYLDIFRFCSLLSFFLLIILSNLSQNHNAPTFSSFFSFHVSLLFSLR